MAPMSEAYLAAYAECLGSAPGEREVPLTFYAGDHGIGTSHQEMGRGLSKSQLHQERTTGISPVLAVLSELD